MKKSVTTFSIITLLLVNVFLFTCKKSSDKYEETVAQDSINSPEYVVKLVIEDLLSRDEFMMYNTPDCQAVHYAEACAGMGAVRMAGLLQDTLTLNKLIKKYTRVIDENIYNSKNHVDANVYGILPLEIFMLTGDSVFFNQGIELADLQWENPLPNGLTSHTRFWIDDIYMIGTLQAQAFRATGDTIYLERAALEIDAYLKKLQQPNGLFFHGENAPFHWGRGNGWVAVGLAELIDVLPESNEHYSSIEDGYVKMMNTLLEYQAEDGMWRQLIDHEESWKETSCTAMFGYAMTLGIKRGMLPKDKFGPATEKAWNSLIKYINEDGRITEVCVGTGQSTDVNYYLERPRIIGDLHGQAPVLWFAHSMMIN